jgi:putative hydrolase of the HAD superfamily
MLDRRFLDAWRTHDSRAESCEDWRRVVRSTFTDWPVLAEDDSFFEALYLRFTQPAAWHIFEDVLPVLDRLHQAGVRLGVLSNWDDRLRPLLGRLDLARWFDVFIVSCERGCRKPDRLIFEIAAESLGLPPESILHVGDSWELDILGAQSAGFQALHLCRAKAAKSSCACPTLAAVPARVGLD